MSGLSIIIPSKTASNLMPCVRAIRDAGETARIIVVDDGMQLQHGEDHELRNRGVEFVSGLHPFVFARNINIGIRASDEADDVILLNDDVMLQAPSDFTAMQRSAQLFPEFGIISATTNLAGNPDQRPMGIGLRDSGGKSVAFVCVLVPRRTIDRIGLLDERFTAYGWEDNDYCRRVREAGLKVGIFDGCFVDHASLKSTFRGDPGAAGNIYPGMEIYRQKWGDLE